MTNEKASGQAGYITQERIQGDLDYKMAQRIAKFMMDSGLISADEFNKLSDINLKTFSPLYAEIYPTNA
jgi:predicted transcriptional regulator